MGIAPQSPDGYLSNLNGLPPSPALGSAYGQDVSTIPNGPALGPPAGQSLPLPGEPPIAQPGVNGLPLPGEEGNPVEFGVVDRLEWRCREVTGKLWYDVDNYLSWTTAGEMVIAVGVDAILANTPLDQHFQNWFQSNVRTSGTDHFSNSIAFLGHGQVMIPTVLGLAVAGTVIGDNWVGNTVGDFGSQTARAYLIGAPSLLMFQYGLGASRPSDDYAHGSYWRPFSNSHGASGDAYIGSVPFITAANMTDNIFLKAGLFLCSTMVAFERVDVNQHYLSQVILGWSLGYMAAAAVGKTERDDRAVIFGPVVTPDLVGVGIDIRR
jgi:membrane-associated phospholipid phosphatase